GLVFAGVRRDVNECPALTVVVIANVDQPRELAGIFLRREPRDQGDAAFFRQDGRGELKILKLSTVAGEPVIVEHELTGGDLGAAGKLSVDISDRIFRTAVVK